MIVTRQWLNEWIDLEGRSADEISDTFNKIGLEVDSQKRISIPEKIVIGYVKECFKHPEADKLSVCQVDIGDEVHQIVCGGANVDKDMHVPVATVGTVMLDGLEIKPLSLRGVESSGMICSAQEIGLPKMGDGILVLDESIGQMKIGASLSEYELLNDDIIEIELTANRGDCLSVLGVARDLSASFNTPLKKKHEPEDEPSRLGIGRVLQLDYSQNLDVDLRYNVLKSAPSELPLLMHLRLSFIDAKYNDTLSGIIAYAIHCTGVILRAYSHSFFLHDDAKEKAKVTISADDNGMTAVCRDHKASVVGIYQERDSMVSNLDDLVLLEASYINPIKVSILASEDDIETDELFYRTSRGSEPNLSFGMNYIQRLIKEFSGVEFYAGSSSYESAYEDIVLNLNLSEVESLIGQSIDKSAVVQILQNLGFRISKSDGENIVVIVPRYRHDIANREDIIEEIVRMVGIDNISSKPLELIERNNQNLALINHKKRRVYRERAAASGFFEAIHFIFNERSKLEKYGFSAILEDSDLVNPIAETLDTLRPTLMVALIESASSNIKNGVKRVALFESGVVFDTNRDESAKFSFIQSGFSEHESISNSGKPKVVDFGTFTQSVALAVGDFTLEKGEFSHSLANPYQSATVIIDGKKAGELFKLHSQIESDYDLPDTFLCELDYEALNFSLKEVAQYSKFQASTRDLTLIVPKGISYTKIKEVINSAKVENVQSFYPVDIYESEELGDMFSLSVRFSIQSSSKTLQEEEITEYMDKILSSLNEAYGVTLR